MRYSKEHKGETRARIVAKASVRLREKGLHGVGVADLMKDAGLTHGGFYAHFDSREALVVEAFSHAMDNSIRGWRKLKQKTPAADQLAASVDHYLTPAHRDSPGRGCAVPTLGADVARETPKTRRAFAAKLDQMIDEFAAQIPDQAPAAARRQAMASLSTMIGALLLSRIAGNGELSDEILEAGRAAARNVSASKNSLATSASAGVAADKRPTEKVAPARKSPARVSD